MQLVPPELRFGKIPCHQIPLNASGETLDSLYRYGDDHEIEAALKNWLLTTIAELLWPELPLAEARKELAAAYSVTGRTAS
jgi:hypothetical protein